MSFGFFTNWPKFNHHICN